jgi:hypothetical protein
MPARSFWRTKRIERTTSASCTNWNRGSKPRIDGTSGSWSSLENGVSIVGPRTLLKRSSDTVTCGLSTAKSRT